MGSVGKLWWRRAAAGCAAVSMAALGMVTTAVASSAATPPSTTVTVTEASASAGLTVDVKGADYADLPPSSTGAPANGVYVVIRDPKVMSNAAINANPRGVLAVERIANGQITDGSWSTDLHVDAAKLKADGNYQVIVWVADGLINSNTLLDTVPVTLTSAQHAALFTATTTTTATSTTATTTSAPPTSTTTSAPTSTTTSTPQCTTENVPAKAGTPQLSWGVKAAFVTYVESNIANGTVTTSGGAAQSDDGFTWGAGTGSWDKTGHGTVSFPGVVHFTGHQGVLNVTLSNIRVKLTGSDSGTLIADVQSTDMTGKDVSGNNISFATLHFSSLTATGGTATATLTKAGAIAFAGFYQAGEALDPVHLTVSGARAATTTTHCASVGAASASPDQLAFTGIDTASMTSLGAALAAAGALLLMVGRRRRVARH